MHQNTGTTTIPKDKYDLPRVKKALRLSDEIAKNYKLSREGKWLVCNCPFHKENTPSFKVNDFKGKYQCFGCGVRGDIFDYLEATRGMRIPEAVEYLGFKQTGEQYEPKDPNFKPVWFGKWQQDEEPEIARVLEESEKWQLVTDQLEDVPVFDQSDIYIRDFDTRFKGKIETVFTYHRADGSVLGYVIRGTNSKGKKMTPAVSLYRHCETKELRWCLGKLPEPRPLYNILELNKNKKKPVLVVEGEKSAKAGAELMRDFVVVTWSGGANTIDKTDWSPLVNRDVYIWPDADPAGLEAAVQISEKLERCQIIKPPRGKPKGWDIADFVEEGGRENEAERIIFEKKIAEDPRIFPKSLCKPFGLLGDLAEYILSISSRPHPLLAVGAAIAVLAALNGQKYSTEDDVHSNLYVISLAPSGTGKGKPLNIINEILIELGCKKDLIIGNPASGAALMKALIRNSGRGIITFDEFGKVLKSWTDRNASTHKQGIVDNLLQIFSQSNSVLVETEYSSKDNQDDDLKVLTNPNLTFYGTSVAGNFYKNFNTEDSINGFIARMLVLQGVNRKDEEKKERKMRKMPVELKAKLIPLTAKPTRDLEENNIDPGFIINIVPYSPGARKLMEDFKEKMTELAYQAEEAEDMFSSSVYNRAWEMASKLALIGRINDEVIDTMIVRWAIDFVETSQKMLVTEGKHYIFDSAFAKQSKEIERFLEQRRRYVTREELRRKFRIDAGQLDKQLEYLLDTRIVEEKKDIKVGSCKPTISYRYRK